MSPAARAELLDAVKLIRKLRGGLRFFQSRFTQNSAILLYHRVAEKTRDPFNLCVTPAHFAAQMERLRRLGNPLSVGDFIHRHRDGTLTKHSLCLTFDDGYVDFLENALPVLEKFELPAVIYCVSGHLGDPFWWDRILTSLHDSEKLPGMLELQSGEDSLSLEVTTTGLDEAFQQLYSFFRQLPPESREALLRQLEAQTRPAQQAHQPRLMTAREIETLSAHPLITIGAHTASHSSLAGLPAEEQFREIDSSRKSLEKTTGTPVTTLSYPFGLRHRDYTRETTAAARKTGLDHALAADLGVVTPKSDPFSLPRLWIHDSDGPRFERKLKLWL